MQRTIYLYNEIKIRQHQRAARQLKGNSSGDECSSIPSDFNRMNEWFRGLHKITYYSVFHNLELATYLMLSTPLHINRPTKIKKNTRDQNTSNYLIFKYRTNHAIFQFKSVRLPGTISFFSVSVFFWSEIRSHCCFWSHKFYAFLMPNGFKMAKKSRNTANAFISEFSIIGWWFSWDFCQ